MATTTQPKNTDQQIEYMTVREAAQLVNMSPSSVRRVIYPILEKDTHPDRALIAPGVAEAKKLRLAGHNFAWKISKELLMRQMDMEKRQAPTRDRAKKNDGENDAIVDILRKELEIKNKQIEQQSEVIKGLSERVREGNILMASLQKHLALPSAKADAEMATVTEEVPADMHQERKENANRKSFLSLWFGR